MLTLITRVKARCWTNYAISRVRVVPKWMATTQRVILRVNDDGPTGNCTFIPVGQTLFARGRLGLARANFAFAFVSDICRQIRINNNGKFRNSLSRRFLRQTIHFPNVALLCNAIFNLQTSVNPLLRAILEIRISTLATWFLLKASIAKWWNIITFSRSSCYKIGYNSSEFS